MAPTALGPLRAVRINPVNPDPAVDWLGADPLALAQSVSSHPILAAAVIMKLPARQSSLILSEMEAQKAAMVAAIGA